MGEFLDAPFSPFSEASIAFSFANKPRQSILFLMSAVSVRVFPFEFDKVNPPLHIVLRLTSSRYEA